MENHAATADHNRGVLTDVMRLGLLVLDRDGSPIFANRLAYELLGCTASQLGDVWQRLAEQLGLEQPLTAAMQCEPAVELSPAWRLSAPPLTAEPLQLEVVPLHGRGLDGAAVLLKDGAADGALSEELLLASRMRAQNYISSALLHDLRAPLYAMEINLELLTDTCHEMRDDFIAGETNVPRRQSDQIVAVLKEELARLNRSLRMVLDHNGPQLPEAADFDLIAMIQELAVLLRPQARRQRIAIDLQLPPTAVLLQGQRDQIRQALLNVAINSLEAMPPGGKLNIWLGAADGVVRIRFSDTGPGIPIELLDKVQRVYFTTKESGTGMGLFVTQLVAESHGGSLKVENSPEGGTTVTLLLPLLAAPDADARPA